MSWRTIVITSNAKLDYQMGYLVVRSQKTTKILLSEIGTLVVESTAVSMTAYLLSELTKHKVNVIFCDEKRNPSSTLQAFYGCHDTSEKIRKQIKWTDYIKSAVWTEIVTEKIRKQAALLNALEKPEAKILKGYVGQVTLKDATNREGHAAKVYFNALFGKKFTRSLECSINAALNYGYTLILSAVCREIVSNGYMTQIGLWHDNMFNPYNLGSDLMEPFRPLVDHEVYNMQPQQFEKNEKHKMLDLLNHTVQIDRRDVFLGNAIKIYVKSVFDAINDKDIALIRFYKDELSFYARDHFI
ncbi:CRISPR-associated endonuclease Cas1, NMENI subtype [Pseudoramibacter alactolyticus ATCC 23263]|uniref:CRISPR-associated endonuclease Cas1 n=1 Tax=Pseudoramibacter alactolyticus ATCC 23263 TaxID=887929 RepID=E6MK10_9FIRM|nr:type II CRISPR-associated endonuclease Cas1 [Pseudoramibacter alactolyticus]EFV00529.1 CRISPR-associated endonuclease Cas1, NMENI subtype [Pseudoramibacter alactolyticus ATCC 23263]